MQPALLADLAASGLEPQDLSVRDLGQPEKAATNCPETGDGYVIPYYDIEGNPIPFYRVKLINHNPKYKQPKNTSNHIYFPVNFLKCLRSNLAKDSTNKVVILTEGEKKAAAATKAGFPTVGVGGVDSWRSRSIVLPEDTELITGYGKHKTITAKLPTTHAHLQELSTLAVGMKGFINLCLHNNLTLLIVFDTDDPQGLKADVQRAAAHLGYELRHEGLPAAQIRLLTLPILGDLSKVGLDDYLLQEGAKGLVELIAENLKKRSAFPRHPSPRAFINSRLEKAKLTRRESQEISMAVLSELDARGRRFKSKAENDPYFFDEVHSNLMPAGLLRKYGEPLHESAFGSFLYREYGLSSSDHRLLSWLASQFTGEPIVEEVTPCRVMTLDPLTNSVAYQVSDSQFALVNAKGMEILSNGSEGILFEQDQVEPLDVSLLQEQFTKQQKKSMKSWWSDVLDTVNMLNEGSKKLAALLYYVSPWLNHWRGIQLPVEILCGEAGSGKSSLYELRLHILTGRPHLRNVSGDIRDWHASITSSGGLHVTDNVQFTNRDIRQRISDEICRLVTEPNPHIEMRKLYTSATQLRVPVTTTFAFTAIQQPFHNSDLIQRAAVFELSALDQSIDSDWVDHQLDNHQGRETWVAHHLVFVHKFFKVALEGGWDEPLVEKHRLAHYERCLIIASKVFDQDSTWVPETLTEQTRHTMSESDWALDGLKEYAEEMREGSPNLRFSASDIAAWAGANEDYLDNQQITNARRLGRYMAAHMNIILRTCGIRQTGMAGNRKIFQAVELD